MWWGGVEGHGHTARLAIFGTESRGAQPDPLEDLQSDRILPLYVAVAGKRAVQSLLGIKKWIYLYSHLSACLKVQSHMHEIR